MSTFIGDGLPQNSVITASSALTLTTDMKFVKADATSAAFTITLPSASSVAGKEFVLKKVDTTANLVTIDGAGSETIDGLTTRTLFTQNDVIHIVSDGANWVIFNENRTSFPVLLSRTVVDLTSAAQTTLFTVPAGRTLKVSKVVFEGKVLPTGSTKVATVKIGTTAGSYIDGPVAGTASVFDTSGNKLLAVGERYSPAESYNTGNTGRSSSFAAASVIKADVSTAGALPTTGEIYVELYGFYTA